MNKVLLTLMIIGIVSILIAGYFLIFNKKGDIKINKDLPKANLNISINGQESKPIEDKCNSNLIKCTKQGCEEVC